MTYGLRIAHPQDCPPSGLPSRGQSWGGQSWESLCVLKVLLNPSIWMNFRRKKLQMSFAPPCLVWHFTQCSVSHGHGPNLGGWAGSKVPLMILYWVRCPWCQKRWWWGAPDLFVPGTVPLRISDYNFCLKSVPWVQFYFLWLFQNQNCEPYQFRHFNYTQLTL